MPCTPRTHCKHHFCMLNSLLSISPDKSSLLSALCKLLRVLQCSTDRNGITTFYLFSETQRQRGMRQQWHHNNNNNNYLEKHTFAAVSFLSPRGSALTFICHYTNDGQPHNLHSLSSRSVSYHKRIHTMQRLSFLQDQLSRWPSLLLHPSPLPVHLRSCL